MLRKGRFYLTLMTMAVIMVSSACSSAGDTAAPDSDLYTSGQTVYNMQCASCHGVNGEGQFPNAPLEPDITGRYGAPPHDDTGHTWHHDDDLIVRIIREGGMGDPVNFYVMPAFETVLPDEDIEVVIAYIKTMWTSEQQAMQRERTLAVRAEQS